MFPFPFTKINVGESGKISDLSRYNVTAKEFSKLHMTYSRILNRNASHVTKKCDTKMPENVFTNHEFVTS